MKPMIFLTSCKHVHIVCGGVVCGQRASRSSLSCPPLHRLQQQRLAPPLAMLQTHVKSRTLTRPKWGQRLISSHQIAAMPPPLKWVGGSGGGDGRRRYRFVKRLTTFLHVSGFFFSLVNLSLLILPLLSSGQLLHMGKNTKVNDWPILSPPPYMRCMPGVRFYWCPSRMLSPPPQHLQCKIAGYSLSLGAFLIPSRIDSIFNPAWFRGCNTFSIGNAGDLSFSLSPRFSPPPLLFQFFLCSRFSVHAREWSVCVLMRKVEFFHFYHSFINPLTGARWLFWSAGRVLWVGGAETTGWTHSSWQGLPLMSFLNRGQQVLPGTTCPFPHIPVHPLHSWVTSNILGSWNYLLLFYSYFLVSFRKVVKAGHSYLLTAISEAYLLIFLNKRIWVSIYTGHRYVTHR